MDDHDLDDLEVRERVGRELDDRHEAIEHALLFEDAQSWTLGDRLPVVRSTIHKGRSVGPSFPVPRTNREHGELIRGEGPVVFVPGERAYRYETFEDAARDGWRATR